MTHTAHTLTLFGPNFYPMRYHEKQSVLQIEDVTAQDRATGMLFHEGDTIAGQL